MYQILNLKSFSDIVMQRELRKMWQVYVHAWIMRVRYIRHNFSGHLRGWLIKEQNWWIA